MVPQPDDPWKSERKIDISQLTAIIDIDEKNQLCVAEAGTVLFGFNKRNNEV